MESNRFDDLAKVVGGTTSRRTTLRAALGAITALTGLAGAAKAAKRSRRVDAEACIPTGKICSSPKPRGRKGKGDKKPKQLSCNDCCQRRVVTNPNGNRVCYCAPEGDPCTEHRECCDSGACVNGLCSRTATASVPPPPPPPPPPPTPVCKADGLSCAAPSECCTQICNGGVCGRPASATCAVDPDACVDGFTQCGGTGVPPADTCYCYRTTEGESRCLRINQLTHPNCAGTPCNSSAECPAGEFCAALSLTSTCCAAKICGPACAEFSPP